MHGNDSNGSCAFWARGFAALWAVLVLAAAISARPAEAHQFTYVTESDEDNTVWMIDTATNKMVATIPRQGPFQVAVTPDGKYRYVANDRSNDVLVIATATNKVVATVPVGKAPFGVTISLDGKHAFVQNRISDTVSVIDTSTNNVVETVPAGKDHFGVAIAPDGKHITSVK